MTPIVFVLCQFYDYNRVQVVGVTNSRDKALEWAARNSENFFEECDFD